MPDNRTGLLEPTETCRPAPAPTIQPSTVHERTPSPPQESEEFSACAAEHADESIESIFGPVIHQYTRAQAIADGVLVDVSKTAREAGLKWPVALTRAVWVDCAEWTERDKEKSRSLDGQSTSGRLWDILYMARIAIIASPNTGDGRILHYEIERVPKPGCDRRRRVRLKLVTGPGDNHEPVMTIMLPDED